MLTLSRGDGQAVVINANGTVIQIYVRDLPKASVSLVFDAPDEVVILRKEKLDGRDPRTLRRRS